MRLIFTLVFCCILCSLKAQTVLRDTIQRRYDYEFIHPTDDGLYKGDEHVPRHDLKYLMNTSPEAFKYFQRSEKMRKTAIWFTLTGLAVDIAAACLVNTNKDLAAGMNIGGSVLVVGGLNFAFSAHGLFNKALRKRNRDILLRP